MAATNVVSAGIPSWETAIEMAPRKMNQNASAADDAARA